MRATLFLIAMGCMLAPVCGQYWSDDFDSYPAGQLAQGAGGWDGWDAVAGVMGDIVTSPARSAPNSLQIGPPGDDTVYPYVLNDPTGYPRSCQWRLTGWWYIDGATFTAGDQYILLQNVYNHGGPYTWSLQMRASPATGTILDDNRPEAVVPVITDQWVEVRIDIDLDADTITTYYGGTQVSTGVYTVSGGPTEIQNLDLFTPGPTSVAYWDDFSLVQTSPSEYQLNRPNASLDVDGVLAARCAKAVTTKATNSTATLNITSPLSGNSWDMGVVLNPSVPLSGGGLPVGTQILNLDPTDPSLFFLNLGTPLPSPMPFTGSVSVPLNTGPAAFTASAQFFISDPSAAEGLSFSQASQLDVVGCGTQENFDNLPTGSGNAPIAWVNPSSGTAWTVHTGGTTSFGTGPTAASSAPNYMYCETSGSGGTANFVMDTCQIDLNSLSTNTLNFDLSRIGTSIGTLNVWMDDGTGTFTTLLTSYAGADPTQSQGGTEWTAQSIPFVPTGASTVAFRFDYTGGGSFTGDIAIDNFDVQ